MEENIHRLHFFEYLHAAGVSVPYPVSDVKMKALPSSFLFSGRRRGVLRVLGAVPRAATPLRHVLPLRLEVRRRGHVLMNHDLGFMSQRARKILPIHLLKPVNDSHSFD